MSDPIHLEASGLQITAPVSSAFREILSDEALAFIAELAEEFRPRLEALLAERESRQARFDDGELPDFLPDTQDIRDGDWTIAGIPDDLLDRRVEITGPVDRKMIINALNADVKVFMADFEDSLSPTWDNVIQGQINLRDANLRTIEFTNPANGKEYKLKDEPALLIARVRGLHLPEKHILYKGKPVPGSLIDFGLYLFHNHKTRADMGTGVYFYNPKIQSHQEAKWWDDVFAFGEQKMGLKTGTIKATFLIETLPAVFEMDEILYALKDHIVALNCGRWDYIFSYIKTLRNHPDRILPDRQVVSMDQPFLSAYSRLLIKTCHKRGAMAMGGMAAFIPLKDPEANEKVLKKVVADKELEASNGHDGTWVAHPGLADTAMNVFNQYIPDGKPNLMSVSRDDDAPITAADLLEPSQGEATEEGMRHNIRVSVQYIEAWISGNGCVPIYGLMEDAATAEISRASIWQWIHHGHKLSNGKTVTSELFRQFLSEEMENIRQEIGNQRFESGQFKRAGEIMDELTTSSELTDFLTIPAYLQLA